MIAKAPPPQIWLPPKPAIVRAVPAPERRSTFPFPFFAPNIAEKDPYFANVLLLLLGEGTNGSTDIIDSSGYARSMTRVVVNSTPVISTAQAPPGAASSIYCNGSRLTTPYDAAWIVGTNDLTIEAWVYPTGANTILFSRSFSGNNYFHIHFDGSNRAAWSINNGTGGPRFLASNPTPQNQWSHLACERVGNDWAFYHNGAPNGGGSFTVDLNSTNTTAIGVGGLGHSSFQNFVGYFNLRVTMGVARYGGAFTPPTSFPLG